jgi:hypothetical protein
MTGHAVESFVEDSPGKLAERMEGEDYVGHVRNAEGNQCSLETLGHPFCHQRTPCVLAAPSEVPRNHRARVHHLDRDPGLHRHNGRLPDVRDLATADVVEGHLGALEAEAHAGKHFEEKSAEKVVAGHTVAAAAAVLAAEVDCKLEERN